MKRRRSKPRSGPDAATVATVRGRDEIRCARCLVPLAAMLWSIHHRQRRGMGGTRAEGINHPTNLILLCGSGTTGCHGWVHANPAQAYEGGWMVHTWEDPATVPMTHAYGGKFLLEGNERIDLQ